MSTLPVENPYPGLRPFLKSEAHLFFGRENQIDAIVDKLSAAHLVAVIGTSGSGKTSLVNCGLLPALHRGLMSSAGSSWKIVQFRPGGQPIAALASALAAPEVLYSSYSGPIPLKDIVDTSLRISKRGLVDTIENSRLPAKTNVLIVVDQFEELFRYRRAGLMESDLSKRNQEASAFVELLLEARRQTTVPIYIAITMRSDFLGNAAEFPGLPEAINKGQYLVPRMTREDQKSAIQCPARVGGADISAVLLTRLVNDVGDNPDQLSILQHALNRTWAYWYERGGNGSIDLADYEAIGTMAHAIDQHAERAFGKLPDVTTQLRCERIFKMLTDRGTDSRGIRRPLEFSKLCALTGCSAEELTEVLRTFREPSQSFLMPPLGEPLEAKTVVDISHESLMRIWERLKRWVDEESLSAQQYIRLADAARRRPATALWGDPDLPLALEWQKKEQPSAIWATLYGGDYEAAFAFLAESEAVWAKALQEKKQRDELELNNAKRVAEDQRLRAEDEARAARRLRWIVAAVFICLGAAVWQWISATQAKKRAEAETKRAEAETKRAETAKKDADESRGKYLVALKFAQNEQGAEYVAEENAETARGLAEKQTVRAEHEARRNASHELAQASSDSNLGPDLQLLLALRAVSLPYEHGEPVEPEAQNALERELQHSGLGRMSQLSSGHTSEIRSVAFSPNGRYVATGSLDGTTRVWDSVSGLSLFTLTGQPGRVFAVAFSPDGRKLATGGDGKVIDIWDASSGTHLYSLVGHTGPVDSLAFNDDGKLLSGSLDSTARVWDLRSPQADPLIFGHTNGVLSVAFDADGIHFATTSKDGSVRLWNLAKPREPPSVADWQSEPNLQPFSLLRSLSSQISVLPVSFSPDGKMLAVGGNDQHVRIWNPDNLKSEPRVLDYPAQPVAAAAFSPDGKRLGVGGNTAFVLARLSETRSPYIAKIEELSDPANKSVTLYSPSTSSFAPTTSTLVFNLSGRRIATASSQDSSARIWDSVDAQELVELADSSVQETPVAITGNGDLIAAIGSDGSLRLFDGRSGLERYTLPRSGGQYASKANLVNLIRYAAFGMSGNFFAEVDRDGTALIWDTATGKQVRRTSIGSDFSAMALSGNGTQLAFFQGKELKLQETTAGAAIQVLSSSYVGSTPCAIFSLDGRFLAATTSERVVTLWNFATGKKMTMLQSDAVDALAFSPDGRRLAIAVRNGFTTLSDTGSGQALPHAMETGIVSKLAFDSSGANLATISQENNLRNNLKVWVVDSGTELFSVNVGLSFSQLAFRPSGQLVTVSRNLFLQEYPLDIAELLAAAQRRVMRSWTLMECQRYLHSLCPDNFAALAFIAEGNHLLSDGNLASARAKYGQAQDADSRLHFDGAEEFRQMNVELLLAQGRALAWKGDATSAAAMFQQARQLDPHLAFNVRNAANHLAATAALAKGRNLARQEDPMATASLELANQLDPGIGIIPKDEANKWIARSAFAKGVALAERGNTESAFEQFDRAFKLDQPDPDRLNREKAALQVAAIQEALSGDLKGAAALWEKTLELTPHPAVGINLQANRELATALIGKANGFTNQNRFPDASAALSQVDAIYIAHPEIGIDKASAAASLNNLCWQGSLKGQGAQVMSACNKAVAYTNDANPSYRDSRGLARAMTGDKPGAIQDFQYFADSTPNTDRKKQRLAWIDVLKHGGDPFTASVLDSLASQ